MKYKRGPCFLWHLYVPTLNSEKVTLLDNYCKATLKIIQPLNEFITILLPFLCC